MNEPETKRLWITGVGGLIGSHVARQAAQHSSKWTAHAWNRANLDLTDHLEIQAAFKRSQPSLIIHCAAMSKSAACDANPSLAQQVNVESTRILCDIAGEVPVWFISTDLVFDGKAGAYSETAEVNPLTFYGRTKVDAERHVLAHPQNAVFRLSLNGGCSPTGDRGFNEEFRRSIERGVQMKLFVDEFRCPAAAATTADVLWRLAHFANLPRGIFHLCGSERLSRFQIGKLLLGRWGMAPSILQPGTLRDHQGPPRSPDTSMTCDRIESLLGSKLPGFQTWLEDNPEAPF